MRTSMPGHTYAHTHSHLHMYMHACMSTDHPQNTTHTPYTHTPQIHTHIYIHAGKHERASERERAKARESAGARERQREREDISAYRLPFISQNVKTNLSLLHAQQRSSTKSLKTNPISKSYISDLSSKLPGKKRSLTTSMFGWKTYRRTKESVPVTDGTE